MYNNDQKKIFKNRMRHSINKYNNISTNNKEGKREIDRILAEYEGRHNSINQNPKQKPVNTILKLNKTYNSKKNEDFFFGKKLSKRKKLEAELFTFSKENRNLFQNALVKHKFEMEVYVPQNLINKEYSNKNYLINKLIFIENMNKNIKEKIEPIDKETKQFSKQYKLIKLDNKDKQKTYVNKVEKEYINKGYKIEHIEYKENENIFTPSFLLDKNFGKEQQKDSTKYSNKNPELNKDQKILQKLNIFSNKYNEDDSDEEYKNIKYNTNENWNEDNEKDEEMKKEILEEKRIMKMNKKEYRAYNRELKKDISLIKKRIDELNKNKIKSRNESELNENKTNYIGITNIKSNLDIERKIKEYKNKKVLKVIQPTKPMKKLDDEKNIFLSARGLDLQTDFNKILPSINSIIEGKKEKEIKNKTIETSHKDLKKNNKGKSQKQKKIYKLYNFLNNNKGYDDFPKREIENYFKKYSHRELPNINTYTGSNIHGIFGDFKNQVKENSFINIAKGNEYIRINMDNNYISNNSNLLENKIRNIDEEIKKIDYKVIEKLLLNNKKEILNN